MSIAEITVTHTFEAGHRLPHLDGKCQSLHGHSWKVAWHVRGPVQPDGTAVVFAHLKTPLRAWVDEHLDHGLMLGTLDPLLPILREHGKTYPFGRTRESHTLNWPTVENVAALLAAVAQATLDEAGSAAWVHRVDVQETRVNTASWIGGEG